MKFLCDRCKTRYSIGDDRVRGKILKIRCKNCANVITVREGMTADPVDDDRRMRPTTAAPMAAVVAPVAAAGAGQTALASAFAQQLAKPPPALEEEWYVSIDGVQAGPFGLAVAQRWVAGKAFDADLHCWSEGFDDWLPVDKVSHFRGLRRKPVTPRPPTAPPPMPRSRAPEDEPKPLFAATMASLEKASVPAPAAAMRIPAIAPTNGMSAKANGTGPALSIPTVKPVLPAATKTNGTGPSQAQTALAAAFDVPNEPDDASADGDALFKNARRPAPVPAIDDHDDDNLDIGEVSRVVKLADLAKASTAQQQRRTKSHPSLRATGSTPKLDPAALGLAAASSTGALVANAAPAPTLEPLAAAPAVAQAHRRGLIMLIGVAAVLLAGVAVLVVLMMNKEDSSDDLEQGSLGHTHEIDTSRPEEVVRAHMSPQTNDGSAATVKQPVRHFQNPNTQHGPSTVETPDVPGVHLKPEEIEDMAQKQSAGTQRCYMRAQRGAEGVLLGDLKKISVTLSIDKTGAVSDVLLSDHGTDSLGTCLASQIKHWKFRESAGGQFRIVLAFADN